MSVRRVASILLAAGCLWLTACEQGATAGPPADITASTTPEPSTTSTTSTTRTTALVFLRKPLGLVVPYETGIYLRPPNEPLSALAFGTDAELVMAEVSRVIGSSARDTGWYRDELCDGTATRRITWGDLELVFTRNANGFESGSQTFQQWYVSGLGTRPAPFVTPEGIGLGSTVSDLKHAYAETKVTRPRPNEDMGLFISLPEGGPFIQGFTRDTGENAPVESMWAGLACQRIE